ncbi:MAG TPA: recombination mediator RecR [Patescibacteria group bacterium]
MKQFLPRAIQDLSQALSRLPGIGPKTANRLAFYLINRPKEEVAEIGAAFINLKENLLRCEVCHTVSETNPCPICADEERDHARIMVVEEPLDMVAMERTGYEGIYHVLGGVISPINGVGPRDLTLQELFDRVQSGTIEEVILATDPSLEGEATASYITEKLMQVAPKGLAISRIARGLPVGGDLEYADELTLRRALEGRQNYRTK